MKLHWLSLLAGVVLLGACNRGLENKEAVRQAVIDHLSSRSNLNVASMQVDVTAVTFRKDEADATVSFQAKGSTGGGMTMSYKLERTGNRWVVKGKSDTGGMPHGAMGGGEAPSGGMPPGHPPAAGQTQQEPGTKK